MISIVLNIAATGLALTNRAVVLYAERKGLDPLWATCPLEFRTFGDYASSGFFDHVDPATISYWTAPPAEGGYVPAEDDKGTDLFLVCEIRRDDETLIGVVRDLGEAASAPGSDLRVCEIESGYWRIDEEGDDGEERECVSRVPLAPASGVRLKERHLRVVEKEAGAA